MEESFLEKVEQPDRYNEYLQKIENFQLPAHLRILPNRRWILEGQPGSQQHSSAQQQAQAKRKTVYPFLSHRAISSSINSPTAPSSQRQSTWGNIRFMASGAFAGTAGIPAAPSISTSLK